jgi:malonyl-CoA decarboxylase
MSPLPALERIRYWWRRLAAAVLPGHGESEADRARARLLAQLEELFEDYRAQRGGEFSARTRAERIAAIYRAAELDQRAAVLDRITHAFAPERDALDAALGAMQSASNDVELSRAEAQLRVALDAPRARFLTQFNLLPDGVKFLVDLRADLLGLLPREPSLEVLKVELDGLLASWFDPGFLELERISWQSPAFVLEKLMAYEAVHPIESWNDLRNRLDTDRRCYAFFHSRMPNEPLIFVEIALLKGMPASVQLLLDQNAPLHDPRTADTAIFYSISNAQRGLRGISLGNLLLKRVIEDLRRDLPQLKVFATLSPLPGFRQ